MDTKREYSFMRLLKDYWFFLKGYHVSFCFFTGILILASLGNYIIPYLLGAIVDFFIHFKEGESLMSFYLYVGGIALTGSLQVILRSYGKMNIARIGGAVRKNVRILAMDKLNQLSLSWHEKEGTGSKIHKIQSGSEKVYQGLSFFSNDGISIISGIVGSILLFVFLNWKYALFGLVYASVFILSDYYFNKALRKGEEDIAKANERMSSKVHETASNVLTVKSLGMQKVMQQSTVAHEDAYYTIWIRRKSTGYAKMKVLNIISSIGYAGFILMIGYDILAKEISVASLFVFASYFERMRDAMMKISNSFGTIMEIQAAVGRIMLVLDKKTRLREETHLLEVPVHWKTLEFRDVSFRYKQKLVLKDFSLTIRQGERIGLVGRSGCGKSTLAKLLLSLYTPQSGKILIDGKELLAYKQSALSRVMSIVLQDSEMFNRPLLDNISITSENVNTSLLRKAIGISQLQPMIDKLPKGLKTMIGEKGYKVSGGERQRIGIARAVYANTDVLILDEATSHLDSKTEKFIQEKIDEALVGKTLLLIAHRLSTLKNADRIIVMDKGVIVDEGTFDELSKRKGLFNELYRMQQHR